MDYLEPILAASGIPLVRLDTDSLLGGCMLSFRLGEPRISIGEHELYPKQVKNVWYRRPEQLRDERFGESPEGRYALSEWSEAVEGFLAHIPKCRWMNHPSANASASHKLEQLSTAASLGFTVPETLVTQDATAARAFFDRCGGRVIAKPMSTGYVERDGANDSLIYTNKVERHHLDSSGDLVHCPTLFQQFVPKRSDVRVTVVDSDVHAVELRAVGEDGMQRCDIRRNNMSDVTYADIELPQAVDSLLRKLVAHYELRFAAIDMAVGRDGEWYFFEVNPNGQWAWLDLSGGTAIASSFVRSFANDQC
nr:hypothetical protein [Candidatus Laterigemmans baculatus]